MFLKSLEILGFKSFPEKTVFSFNSGMTAIVGPNGCGKSNVSDAIKWVIGEQKIKSLRGNHMQDVIFNGSDAIKPLGLAEVSLILDNSHNLLPLEYSEVRITRKLYRSGESEYQINKKPCRLKDITDLLMDTGLGADLYAVIEQGRMNRILDSHPEERRAVFEEAAGITKYKTRRKEALRKLERTTENLVRVNDILTEVTRQMNSIERQARKAQRYQELFVEMKRFDIHVHRLKATEFQQALSEHQATLQGLSAKDQAAAQKIAEVERDGEVLHQQIHQWEEQLRVKQKEWNEAEARYRELENNMMLHEQKIHQIAETRRHKEQDITLAHGKIRQWMDDDVQTRNDAEAMAQELQRLRHVLVGEQQRLEEAQKDYVQAALVLDKQKQAMVDLITRQSKNKDLMAHREQLILQHDMKRDDLLQHKERKEKRTVDVQGLLKEHKQQVDDVQKQIDACVAMRQELQEQQTVLEQDIHQRTEQLHHKQAEHSKCKAELDVLKAMHRNYEGYSQGTKDIFKKRDQKATGYAQIIGDVASLITISQSRFEAAVEAVLGSYVQSIVVPETETLMTILDQCRQARTGRAALVSLDSAESQNDSEETVKQCRGFVSRVLDVVNYDENMKPLMNRLLGHIYIFETLADVVAAHRELSLPYGRLVSLAGEVMEANGIVVGGANAEKNLQLIGREKKIADGDRHMVRLSEDIRQDEAGLLAVKQQLDTVKKNEWAKRKESDELGSRLNVVRTGLSRLELEFQHLQDQMGVVSHQLGDVSIQREEVWKQLQGLKSENERLDHDVLALQKNVSGYEDDVKKVLAHKEHIQASMTEMKVHVGTCQEKEVSLRSRLMHLQQLLKDEHKRIEDNTATIKDLDRRCEELQNNIVFAKEACVQARAAKEQCEHDMNLVREHKQQVALKIREQDMQVQEWRRDIMELQKHVKDEEVRCHQLQFQRDSLQTKMTEAYQLSWDDVLVFDVGDVGDVTLEGSAEEHVAGLKDKMVKMGPVNYEAIQEFESLKERHTFLQQQITDLTEAKESLLQVIAQVNRESKKRFKEAFEQIQQNFQILFKTLFGGGQADLKLLDEDDVLECGIEIMACPPGKKMQTITLMSGGEKSLTGIALLFAMFKVNPSPFCVLDEIDAPLDEMNVERFIDIMDSFKDRTQFILITHNKKTMAKADVIYGITMQKPGISKAITMKFVENENRRVLAMVQ